MALTRITKGVIKPNENYDTHNINSTGIVTAIGLDVNGNGDISGNLNVGGVLTYEDVTSIDSVGIITAQSDIHVGGGVSAVGVGSFGSLDISGDIDVDGHTNLDNVSIAGVTTISSSLNINDNLVVGNSSSDNLTINAKIDSSLIPSSNNTKDLGSSSSQWRDLYVDGHTNLDNVSIAGVTTMSGNLTISNTDPRIIFTDTDNNPDFTLHANGGVMQVENSASGTQVKLESSGSTRLFGNVIANKDLDVDGHTELDNVNIVGVTTITGSTGNVRLDLHGTASGTGSQIKLHNDHATAYFGLAGDTTGDLLVFDESNTNIKFYTNNNERLRITSGGGLQFRNADVPTNNNEPALILNHAGGWQFYASSDPSTHNNIIFGTNSVSAGERLRIASDGTITHSNFNGVGFIMSGAGDPTFQISDTDGTNQFVQLAHNAGDSYIVTRNNTSHGEFLLYSQNGSETLNRFKLHSNGDISCGGAADNNIYNDSSGGGLNFKNGGQLVISKQASSGADPLVWLNDTGQTTNKFLLFAQDGTEKASIGLAGNDLRFARDGYNETMRITDGGDVSIGGRDEALNNYAAGSTTTQLAVVKDGGAAGSGYHEVAHFTGGNDSNDTGAIVRITQFNNDRGLYIKGGRGTGDQAKTIFGLRNSSNSDSDVMTFIQGGNVGIGSDIPSKTLDVNGNIRCGNFTIDRHGDPTIMMTSTSDTGGGSIYFGSPASGVRGGILYNHNGDKLQIRNIYGTSIEITNDRISTFYGDINIHKGSSYPSANLKIQSHDTANATSRIQFLARDNSNNNETCYIQANSGSTASVDLRFGTDTGEHLRITRNGQLWLYASGGDNQFNSKRTSTTSSNGDYYFHLQAINNVDQTVGVLGFHRHSGNDDARFVIHTKQSGVAKEERMRIHADGTVQFSATGSSDQHSAANRQLFEIGSVGGIKLGNYGDNRRATPADASTITGLRAPNIIDWGLDRGNSSYQAGDGISSFSGVWTSWSINGNATGNKWKLGQGPHGAMEWLWSGKSAYSDNTSGQGGWNTSFDVDPNYSYMFITYVKRVSSTSSGNFYVGTGGVADLGSGATSTKSNPYWTCGGVGNLARNVWHVCVHYVRSYHSSHGSKLPNAGTYRMSDGSRIADGANCNIGNGVKFNTTQTGHSVGYRSYLFYATQNDGTELHWAQPHAYKCDGTEPTLMELLGRELANSDDSDNWDG